MVGYVLCLRFVGVSFCVLFCGSGLAVLGTQFSVGVVWGSRAGCLNWGLVGGGDF